MANTQKAIIGKKVGMSQIFDADGKVIPVTVIEAGPCTVVQKKTAEKDGYEAVQLGFLPTTEKHLTMAQKGHLKKATEENLRVLKEVKFTDADKLDVGDVLHADVFAEGEHIDATATSKGKGYAGVIKRHGAHRTPMSHGGGPVHRHAGSMGSTSTPSRIRKGKIGAGQMGNEQVTIKNLEVVKVDPEINLIAVRGAVPGPKGGIVVLKATTKVVKAKQAGASISLNPQKASGRNPQKASARTH
ncbi:MAG: 50S ribosomal protein L3 [Clostridiales bacterium]|nr:50S ribosomal protein L3 [Clostridiales bacterium]